MSWSLNSDDVSQIQDADSLEVALISPDDGEDSDQDDAASTSDESWDTSDDETLAHKQKRLKLQNRTSRKGGKRVQREWKEIILESRDQKVELLDET
nr:unnamed protein product [Callosobruchus analis]